MGSQRSFFPLSVPNEGTVEVRSQPTKPEPLSDYVRRVRGDRSLKEIERNSARKGPKIADTYINRIENGGARRPSADRLVALAHGLGVPVLEVMAVASGKPLSKMDARLARLEKALQSLPEDRQDDIVDFAAMLERKHAKIRAA